MATTDQIRCFVIDHYIEPAREAGRTEVSVRLGDIRQGMGMANPLQSVRGTLNTQCFQDQAGVELLTPIGPRDGADTWVKFRIVQVQSSGA